MLFQHERRQLLGDQHRHRLPLRQRHQLLFALSLEHPPIRIIGPLPPTLQTPPLLAVHGPPPQITNVSTTAAIADTLTDHRRRKNGNAPVLRRTLEAQYIGGYAVECALKALILETTAEPDRLTALAELTHGAKHHRAEILLDRLRGRGVFLPAELAKRMRRFDWTTALRYEAGRKDTGETIGLLRTARAIYQWVEGQMP